MCTIKTRRAPSPPPRTPRPPLKRVPAHPPARQPASPPAQRPARPGPAKPEPQRARRLPRKRDSVMAEPASERKNQMPE